MGRKKKDPTTNGVDSSSQNLPVKKEESALSTFDEASIEAEKNRHQMTYSLFDKAAKVLEGYLEDPSIDSAAKMFPAKLAIDIYTSQEKFKREDQKLDIERRRLSLEEEKLRRTPSNLNFNQQNNYFSGSPQPQPVPSGVDLTELKKRQDELLNSYLPSSNPENKS